MGHAHDHGHTHDDAPLMEDLLRNAPSNWGRWGPDDEVGALKIHRATGSPVNPVVIK